MHHVSESLFLPNNLERDLATRVAAPPRALGVSVADVVPVPTFEDSIVVEERPHRRRPENAITQSSTAWPITASIGNAPPVSTGRRKARGEPMQLVMQPLLTTSDYAGRHRHPSAAA